MRRTACYIIQVLLLTSFLSTCSSPSEIDVDAVIHEKVTERLASFKQVLEQNCRDKVYEEAGLIADSIILEYAKMKKDTNYRPLRPLRPEQPEFQVLEDTLLLEPLFDTIVPSVDTIRE